MRTLTPAERRALRARAHPLHPFVIVGQQGLTPAVLRELSVNLRAHELIKIRVLGDARDERAALLTRICTELDAAPVQQLGKILTIWRPSPEPEPKVTAPSNKRARSKLQGAKRRTGAELEKHSARKPKDAAARLDSQRRKPELRGGATAQVPDDPATRRRESGPRGGMAAPLATDPAARRRRTKR